VEYTIREKQNYPNQVSPIYLFFFHFPAVVSLFKEKMKKARLSSKHRENRDAFFFPPASRISRGGDEVEV